jgi:SAM-dependent methyltransferase
MNSVNKHTDKAFSPHKITWNSKNIQQLWDYYGSSDAHRTIYFGEMAGKHLVRVIKRHKLLADSKTIADFSCGTGAVIEEILQSLPSGSSVTGYDPSKLSTEKTIARNQGSRGFDGAYQIKQYPTSINPNSVDLLLMTEVIEHLDDSALHSVLSECHRILAPNERFILTTPNDENLADYPDTHPNRPYCSE